MQGKSLFIRNIERLAAIKPLFGFDAEKDLETQKKRVLEKYLELVKIPPKETDPEPIVLYVDETNPDYDEIRFSFESEKDVFIPAHLLLPKQRAEKIPLVICLQGHSPGMHVSLAREPYPSKTPITVAGDRDFCLQAVARGYAAIAMEQRGFGELGVGENPIACHELYFQLALMDKSLIGERIRDIIALIDAVEAGFSCIDSSRIGVMGNSGGGTSSYFAACVDERIKVCMPSSSFCTFTAAWGSIKHCCCAYVPGIVKYMEMPDMAMMIAPRHLVIVNGVHDHLQPFEAAREAYKTVVKIYDAAGAPQNCDFVEGDEGHRFYADRAWHIFDEHMKA